ncbi:MAG: hypothetical protein V3S29_02530 [bacterium]
MASPSSSQVTGDQVSGGSQAQKRPQASCAHTAPATSVRVSNTRASAMNR